MNELVQVESFNSKHQTGLNCMRRRLFAYEWPTPEGEVSGVVGSGFSRFTLLGSCVHEGLRLLLTHEAGLIGISGIDTTIDPPGWAQYYNCLGNSEVDIAAAVAVAMWDHAIATEGLASPDGKEWVTEELEELCKSERCLLEGLVRAFGMWMLPRLEEEFDILESEIDRVYQPEPGFRWICKIDSLLRDKQSGELKLMNFKSYAWWGDSQQKQALVSGQNFAEPWAIEGIMREWWERLQSIAEALGTGVGEEDINYGDIPLWFRNGYADAPEPPTISGVMMGVMHKGRETKDKVTGRKTRSSMLVRGWCKDEPETVDVGTGEKLSGGSQWAWSWEVPKVSKTGTDYMGNLGKGYLRFNVWEFPGGVKGWLEILASGQVQPECGDALASLFTFADPAIRLDWAQERWARQMMHREIVTAAKGRATRNVLAEFHNHPEAVVHHLDLEWPQNTDHCFDYASQCPFYKVCFQNPHLLLSLLETGDYKPRKSHHEREGEETE